ncbi:MAG: hypothetical protein Q7J31_16005 [Syntrophales bacterium]|nr:hypothetical protein [Syntrophales bacterium]
MEEERNVIETPQTEEEGKTKKYIRNIFGGAMMALVLLTFVMATLRKCAM